MRETIGWFRIQDDDGYAARWARERIRFDAARATFHACRRSIPANARYPAAQRDLARCARRHADAALSAMIAMRTLERAMFA